MLMAAIAANLLPLPLRSRSLQPHPQAVKLYFRAQLIYTLAVFVGVRLLGEHHYLYAIVYSTTTLLVIETCLFLVMDAHLSEMEMLIAYALGLGTGTLAAHGMMDFTLGGYITFIEGVLLQIVATAMLIGMATSAYQATMQAIALLTLALSWYDFAYVAEPQIDEVNGWLPSTMCAVAFVVTALMRPRQHLPRCLEEEAGKPSLS